MKKRAANKTGFILFSVLCTFLILVIIIIPLMAWAVNEFSWTSRSFNALRALNLADAGAELAIWEIVHNDSQFTGWSGANPKTLTISSFRDEGGDAVGDVVISVDKTAPNYYLITSIGFIPDAANADVKKTVKVKAFPYSLFNNGIFGYNSVTLSGNSLVDSYDSNAGPYSVATAGSDSDIGTNGALILLENSVVNGDIFVGPSGTISGDTSGRLNGDTYYFGNDYELKEDPLIDDLIVLSSLGNLAVGGNKAETIPSGDYRYESISVDGKATMNISNNTRIYVHNDFYVGGQSIVYTNEEVAIYIGGDGNFAGQGIVNTSGTASNLQIYVLGSGSLSYTGQNDFYGTIYAPQSSIYIAGNANFYGAIFGGSIELAGNIKFHYDASLSYEGPFSGFDIAYWQED